MKKILLILLHCHLFAQDYKPMLDTNAEWQVTNCFFGCITDVYYTDGDTIVDNKTYKILDGFHYISRTFLLREDITTRKVYLNILNLGKDEYLLYDYSLSVGDSIDMKNPITPFPESAGYYTLDSIISKPLYNNVDFNHYYFSPSSSNSISNNNAVWIEGIGSLSIVTAPSGLPDINGVGHLSCYFKDVNSDLIYSNLDSISSCLPVYDLSVRPFINSLDPIKVMNTIVNSNCKVTGLRNAKKIKLFDINAKLYLEQEINNVDEIILDITTYDKGLYFLEFSSSYSSKVIKIIKQ